MWCVSHLWVELGFIADKAVTGAGYCVAAGMFMSIKVRYFASLGEKLGRFESDLEIAENVTVIEVWRRDNAGEPMPGNLLAAVNMEYARLDSMVRDGDEVAFFPPVTGG